MDIAQGDEFRKKLLWLFLIFSITHYSTVNAVLDTKYIVDSDKSSDYNIKFILQEEGRYRREAPQEPVTANTTQPVTPTAIVTNATAAIVPTQATTSTNGTTSMTTPIAQQNATASTENVSNKQNQKQPVNSTSVTNTHLLGENCTGIYHGNTTNYTLNGNTTSGSTNVICNNTPKVSEPISPDDDFSDVVPESPETIIAERNITNLKYDHHIFYQSVFIGNPETFTEHWKNITKPQADVHAVLSNSYRRATTLKLKFDFPFYGKPLKEITIATGGFIFTGDHVHHWLATTQYIAPLMANFDTTIGNNSYVKLIDDGEKFTAIWENVNLQERTNETFTFAVTLYKNGDILFAYKDIPVSIKEINDTKHPVKVGISDAYLTDNIMFYVRRKTIYEYHRVNFKNYNIVNGTILKLVALPTCLQLNTCDECLNKETGFTCYWCEQLQRCSSGTDRTKQDWLLRNCDKLQLSNATSCPVPLNNTSMENNLTYVTDKDSGRRDSIVNIHEQGENSPKGNSVKQPLASDNSVSAPHGTHSPIGGFVAAFLIITLISAATAWVLYAFKNPHTRSGQLLIKYRPSQWSWRRGEARYTAATIHM